MKKPRRKLKPLVARCSEDRILQLSNDVSEGIRSGTVEEWRAVALYFRHCFDLSSRRTASLRMSLAALSISEKMGNQALSEIRQWLKNETAET